MKSYPAHFFAIMLSSLKYLIACLSLVLAGISSIRAGASGFLEGHLKIVSAFVRPNFLAHGVKIAKK